MDIICQQCQQKLQIPDEKINQIPPGKVAAIPCPGCKTKIMVESPRKPEKAVTADPGDIREDSESSSYDASEKPFDFIEEEGQTALICEANSAEIEKIKLALDHLEYHVTVAQNVRDVLKKMRYHAYDLVLVNEDFDTLDPDSNGVLAYIERLSPPIRRKIFVAMISSRYRTMDNMTAFSKSVNLVINSSDTGELDKILGRNITDNEMFYRMFNNTLRKMGRI